MFYNCTINSFYSRHVAKEINLFSVGEVEYVELFADEGDKPRGCGIIEFSSPDSVKKAIEKMHRHEVRGRKLVVKEVSYLRETTWYDDAKFLMKRFSASYNILFCIFFKVFLHY